MGREKSSAGEEAGTRVLSGGPEGRLGAVYPRPVLAAGRAAWSRWHRAWALMPPSLCVRLEEFEPMQPKAAGKGSPRRSHSGGCLRIRVSGREPRGPLPRDSGSCEVGHKRGSARAGRTKDEGWARDPPDGPGGRRALASPPAPRRPRERETALPRRARAGCPEWALVERGRARGRLPPPLSSQRLSPAARRQTPARWARGVGGVAPSRPCCGPARPGLRPLAAVRSPQAARAGRDRK